MKPILFPGLGLSITIPRVALTILGKDIYWYGVIIAMGILLCTFLAQKDKQKYGISWEDMTNFLMLAIIFGFLGARFYYVVFQWSYYVAHPEEIFQIWHGGIAIYGGVIGALATAWIYCRKKQIRFLSLCDFCAPYLALGQSIGRWGNFVNQEAYGEETNSFLRMGIWNEVTGEYFFVHPTFLYESLATFFIFIFLLWRKKEQKWEGQIFFLYMILYGLARAFIEGLRTDSLYWGEWRVSQMLAIFFVIAFSGLYGWKQKTKEHCQPRE